MLENRMFGLGLLLLSFMFGFHGAVLLLAPTRYLPPFTFGPALLKLTRKPPKYFYRRLSGILIIAAVGWVFVRPAISMMVQPGPNEISWGQSLLPPGSIRWDLLLFGAFALSAGLLLTLRPEGSAKLMLGGEDVKHDATTLMIWKWYVRLFGLFCLLFSLFPLSGFLTSLYG